MYVTVCMNVTVCVCVATFLSWCNNILVSNIHQSEDESQKWNREHGEDIEQRKLE